MTSRTPAGKKIIVTARIDRNDVAALDALATKPDTVNFRRSRSDMVALAIREYVRRHADDGKGKGKQ
jgi:metal-responsive CopG/Arc/MetJ family transcriptional regulator